MGLSHRHQELLQARGLDVELLERVGVETCDQRSGDWVRIPYVDRGEVINWKYRTVSGEKKFYQDAGSRQIPWNIDCLRDKTLSTMPVVFTEGELDAISAIQCGFLRTLSVPNGAPATAVGPDDSGTRYAFLADAMPLLRGVEQVILATDSDAPGVALMNDLALRFGKARCKWVKYPAGCKDLNDTLQKYGHRGVVEVLQRARFVKVSGIYRMSELPPLREPVPYKIGMVGLEKHYNIRLGDMCVVVGAPNQGKSTLLNEIGCRMAQNYEWTIAYASFEQPPQHDHRRALRTFFHRKPAREQSAGEIAAADKWIDQRFVFMSPEEDDDPTMQWLIERIQGAAIQCAAKLVVIDPWNELEHVRPPGMGESEYTGACLTQLRRLARSLNVHLIVATHPTKLERGRDGKIPIPNLYDASGSAHWANKPDVGIIIHRTEPTRTIIRIQKSRYHEEIGEPGEIQATYLRGQARYEIILPEAH